MSEMSSQKSYPVGTSVSRLSNFGITKEEKSRSKSTKKSEGTDRSLVLRRT